MEGSCAVGAHWASRRGSQSSAPISIRLSQVLLDRPSDRAQVSSTEMAMPRTYRHSPQADGPRDAVALPVQVGGSVIAVLYADAARADRPEDPEWLDTIDAMTKHAGRVLEAMTVRQAAALWTPPREESSRSSRGMKKLAVVLAVARRRVDSVCRRAAADRSPIADPTRSGRA